MLADYKARRRSLRGLPAAVKTILEAIPAAAHPTDVMRTYVSGLSSPEISDRLGGAGAPQLDVKAAEITLKRPRPRGLQPRAESQPALNIALWMSRTPSITIAASRVADAWSFIEIT